MSRENVEIVKEFTRRFAAGDHVTRDYFEWMNLHPLRGAPQSGIAPPGFAGLHQRALRA